MAIKRTTSPIKRISRLKLEEADLRPPRYYETEYSPSISKQLPHALYQPREAEGARERLSKRGIIATEPEAIVYLWLESKGISFEFQSSLMGGRDLPGGAVADFVVYTQDPPMVLRVMGRYWHEAAPIVAFDEASRVALEVQGYTVIDIWDTALLEDSDWVMEQAMLGLEMPY